MVNEMISVIVPVYNVDKYLDKCIETIRNQTYENLEIILIDDGSTDQSGNLCDVYAKQDMRIHVIHQENRGLSGARNRGIEEARGEYLAFIDGDDYIDSRMMEVLLNNMISTQADISVVDFQRVDEDMVLHEIDIQDQIQIYEGANILSRLWMDNVRTVIACNKLYKKSLFDDLQYPIGRYHEDTFIIHRLLYQCSRVVYSNLKLYYYVQHSGSIMNRLSAKRIDDAVAAYEDRICFFEEKGKHREKYVSQKMLIDELLYLAQQQMEKHDWNIEQYIHTIYRRKYIRYFGSINGKKYFYYFLSTRLYMKYSKIM